MYFAFDMMDKLWGERGEKKCILKADSELIMLFTVELSKSVWNEKPGRDAREKRNEKLNFDKREGEKKTKL